MRRPAIVSLAALLLSVVPSSTVSAKTLCDELADGIKAAHTKMFKILPKLFGDCKDLDAEERATLERAIKIVASLKAQYKKKQKAMQTTQVTVPQLSPSLQERTVGANAAKVPVDKRLAFTGKPGFPFGFIEVERVASGAFDASFTLAVGSVGLQNTVTGGSLELDRPPFDDMGQNGFATLLDVAWLEAAHGFLVTARDDTHASLGSLKIIGNTDQIDLRMQQTDTDFTLSVRATPDDRTSEDGWQTVYTAAQAVTNTPFRFNLLARGLDQKATVFFDFFRLAGPNIGGAIERPLMNQIGANVVDPIAAADDTADSSTPDLAATSVSLQLAIDGIAGAKTAIQAAIDGHTLQASTDGKGAVNQLGKASKALVAAKKLADKGNVTKAPAIDKKIIDAARDVAVAIANLDGLNVKSFKKIAFGHPVL